MKSAVVYLPIVCPTCSRETRIPYTRMEIVSLIGSPAPFRLYSACHDVSWLCTESDRQALFALIKSGDLSIEGESTDGVRVAKGAEPDPSAHAAESGAVAQRPAPSARETPVDSSE